MQTLIFDSLIYVFAFASLPHLCAHLVQDALQVDRLGSLNGQAQRSVPDELRQRTQPATYAKRCRVVKRLLEAVVVEEHARGRVDVGEGVLGLLSL